MLDAPAPDAPIEPPEPDSGVAPAAVRRTPPAARVVALAEVVLCSGFPTQLVLIVILQSAGLSPFDAGGRLSMAFVTSLSLADTGLVLGLVLLFVTSHGESPTAVFLGHRSRKVEAWLGAALLPAVVLGVVVIIGAIRTWLPALHNVDRNPLEDLLAQREHTWLFLSVLVVAGGLREEIQRAFILHRFERFLGGGAVGLVVFSLVFGAGHLDQGRDVAVTTTCLGLFWGWLYLRRRSTVAPIVNHSAFNLSEALQFLLMV